MFYPHFVFSNVNPLGFATVSQSISSPNLCIFYCITCHAPNTLNDNCYKSTGLCILCKCLFLSIARTTHNLFGFCCAATISTKITPLLNRYFASTYYITQSGDQLAFYPLRLPPRSVCNVCVRAIFLSLFAIFSFSILFICFTWHSFLFASESHCVT